MGNFTIKCLYNDKECEEELVWDYKEQNQVLEILCNDKIDNNSFTMEYYGDEGILITRNRCKLNVYLTENKTYYDRNYTIICTHANDAEVFVQINITQKAENFALNVEIEEWIPNKQYYKDDRVFYDDHIWRCKENNTGQVVFSEKYFVEVEEIEEWEANTQYRCDIVSYKDSIWRCIKDNISQTDFNEDYFEKVEFEEWKANTQYYIGDRVIYNGSIWRCTVDNTGQVVFSENYFVEVAEIKEWTADEQYHCDRVFYNSSIWRCTEDNTGQAVFNEEYFERVDGDNTVILQSIVYSSNNSEYKYNGDKMYYEEKEIKLNITGGSKKYRVNGIYKCYDEEDNTVHRTTFDNGFILNKNENSLIIRNYGRPFIDEKYYYIIVLEHFDVRDIKKEITIKYTSLENSTTAINSRKSVQLENSKPKIIMPIIQEEKQEKENIVEIKPIEYGLEILEDVEDYTIIDEPLKTILPFTVTEDGVESNLMVKASSSAYWCRVKVIQEYNDNDEIERKLIFRIINKPLIIRKTKITVSIIDLPQINVSFILTNKPS